MSRRATTSSRRRSALVTAIVLVLLLLAVGVTYWLDSSDDPRRSAPPGSAASSSVKTSSAASTTGRDARPPTRTSAARPTAQTSRNPAAVPPRVLRTLALIDAGDWPDAANAPGTRGGIVFRNSERRLPATDASGRRISYQEWDVNPKRPGRSRDAERIVTGSDGRAWYTADHYDTFVLIREGGR
ncbi:ribonuclease domain-containing protein [Gordonia soli]|uniref:Putative guanyl-specific ribonuclease n=1 Tax=Gordonia soli NBRC 108243 TaxID=1223545 RepID=M0QRC6_9ACTN|nr:ribonuclease domain-containing protein [Gordonia soli]GAC70042.1 putative guanyl-specific ribonuclease [Gordonia soli NBRC 108243]